MTTIINDFNGSLERIKNNFYFSFLSLNFINQRPFSNDVTLEVDLPSNKMSAASINNFDSDGVNEYGNSMRRHFLNDMVIGYERYAMQMIASHQNGKRKTEPATIHDRRLGAPVYEQLPNIYGLNEIQFLTQLRRLRNSIVHYNGHYSATNELNYAFGTDVYNSIGKEGTKITIKFDSILWIYDELRRIVLIGNTN